MNFADDDNDQIVPGYTRVSNILKPYTNFEGIPPDVVENKRQIGVRVHKLILMHYECVPVWPVEPDVEPYFESFMKWEASSKTTGYMNERRFYDTELMITGQIDALVKFPDEEKVVMVDWKTSASYNKKTGITWGLQGTFYHHLLTYNDIKEVSPRFLFVQLSPKGKLPAVHEFEYTPVMMNHCLAALQMYRLYNPL